MRGYNSVSRKRDGRPSTGCSNFRPPLLKPQRQRSRFAEFHRPVDGDTELVGLEGLIDVQDRRSAALLQRDIRITLGAPQANAGAPLSVAQRGADHYIASREPALNYADLLTLYGLIRLAEVSGRDDYDAFIDRSLFRLIKAGPATPLSFENYSLGGLPDAYRCVQGRFAGDLKLLRTYVDQLVKEHPRRAAMIRRLRYFCATLRPLQAESGMWRQNLVTPTSYEETSATGLILYALEMGLRKDWLPDSFRPLACRGWRGLAGKVDQHGAVHGTCVSTSAIPGNPLEYYLNRPTKTDDVHSLGPVLLAAVEMHLLECAGAADD